MNLLHLANALYPTEFIYLLTAYYTGVLVVSSILLITTIRNNRIQGEYQLYARVLDARIKIQNTPEFTTMAKESPLFSERFKLVDNPEEYYTIVSLIDSIEFIHRINRRKMIDKELWIRWTNYAKSLMTIPKFKAVWNATKDLHTPDFAQFLDSLN